MCAGFSIQPQCDGDSDLEAFKKHVGQYYVIALCMLYKVNTFLAPCSVDLILSQIRDISSENSKWAKFFFHKLKLSHSMTKLFHDCHFRYEVWSTKESSEVLKSPHKSSQVLKSPQMSSKVFRSPWNH